MLKHAGHVLETKLAASLAEAELTPRIQCVLIHALESERTQIELAELAHLDKTTMVTTVDELERQGWATRQPSPKDRRARVIAVTPAGRRKAQQGQRIVDRVHAEALNSLPVDSRATFASLLTAITESSVGAAEGVKVRRSREAK
jgi:DNA-binding MarR family transcriptional regulator